MIDSDDRNDSREFSYRNEDRLVDVYLDSVIVGSRMNLLRQTLSPSKLWRIDRIRWQI